MSERLCRRVMGAVAALTAFAVEESAAAQHKEDPIGPGAPAPIEKRELAPQAGPTEGRDVLFYASSADAQLEVRYPTGWRVLCEHPCAARAFVGAEYRVAGTGIIPSRTFSIDPNPGPFVLRANVASTAARTVGIALTMTGGLALLYVSGWLGMETIGEAEHSDAATAPAIVAVSGIVLLTAGIVQLATTGTSLSFGPAAAYGGRGSPPVRTVAEPRGPTWLTPICSW
jgi:hypothetical protein